MPKFVGKLSYAEKHPGVVILTNMQTKQVVDQFPASAMRGLLGARKYAYWVVEIRAGQWHFGREVPREEAEQDDAVVLGQRNLPRAEADSQRGKGS